MSTDRIAYGTSTAVACTVTSLASSATVGRSSVAVNNATNLFVDAMLFIKIKTGSGTIANDQCCYVYLYGSEDGSSANWSVSESVGSDASCTVASPTNLKGPYVIACPVAAAQHSTLIGSVAGAFGGILPRYWGYVLVNYTGLSLDATGTNFQSTYTGITYTDT